MLHNTYTDHILLLAVFSPFLFLFLFSPQSLFLILFQLASIGEGTPPKIVVRILNLHRIIKGY